MPADRLGSREGEAGFTLIEVMISLGLFALIAIAGLAMVDGILGVQVRTEARLDRLADLQRAMFVVGNDLDQVAAGPIVGDDNGVSFTRAAPGFGGEPLQMRLGVAGGALVRSAGGGQQLVLGGVGSARWRYLGDGWQAKWPADKDHPELWPRAVELELTLREGTGPGGVLRKLVALPAQPTATP